MLAPLTQDLRYTLRLVRKSPGFFATVVALLGLGIGLNCAIFSLVDALLLRPLPVVPPNELVRLVQIAVCAAEAVFGIVLLATFAAVRAALRLNPASVLRED